MARRFEPDLGQLRALAAVVGEGTFEAAARLLQVTPSAISQRIRALEVATGQVLVIRTKPAGLTEAGRTLLRLARQVELLAADVAEQLPTAGPGRAVLDGPRGPAPVLAVAVNADSLATWVLPALAPLADRFSLDLRRADQSSTSHLLREGAVMAAITSDADAVPGCTSRPLGRMRYRALASPGFVRRHLDGPDPLAAFARAPVVVFDRDDDLQHRYLAMLAGREGAAALDAVGARSTHHVPASADFLAAIVLGFGWGMLPDVQSQTTRRDGSLVVLHPDRWIDVPLHWQHWKLRSPALDALTGALVAGASAHLLP